jgi:hypothetical protein
MYIFYTKLPAPPSKTAKNKKNSRLTRIFGVPISPQQQPAFYKIAALLILH